MKTATSQADSFGDCDPGEAAVSTEPWRERSARLYADLRRPARSMIRRAFGRTFGDDEIEDVYASAWLGTLRALEHRHHCLGDEEIRKYVLTAVAHHAGKELRRRSRRPTAPLENAGSVPDVGSSPEERVAAAAESAVTRDVLASLPPRRRAVMLLRYGWGLEPAQVCRLVKGLSARAYRKEITRGVDEVARKLRLVHDGGWCAEREPVLKAFAAGTADDEQKLQARQHLAHCRPCSEFVGRLQAHLHDLGSSLAIPGAGDALLDGRASLGQRLPDLGHRIREALPGGGGEASDAGSAVVSAAQGARGAGTAGGGVLAKLAGLGSAGKVAALCLGGGAATACLAAGVVPVGLPATHRAATAPAPHARAQAEAAALPGGSDLPADPTAGSLPTVPDPTTTTTTTTTTTAPATTTSTTAPPPAVQQFGLAGSESSSSGDTSAAPGPGGGKDAVSAAQFGP